MFILYPKQCALSELQRRFDDVGRDHGRDAEGGHHADSERRDGRVADL